MRLTWKDARATLFVAAAVVFYALWLTGTIAAATRVADRCGDPRDRARADLQLIANDRRADAVALARRMVRDNPEDYVGWVAVYRLTGSRAAFQRARELNPRGVQR